jgi:hypothetical protein
MDETVAERNIERALTEALAACHAGDWAAVLTSAVAVAAASLVMLTEGVRSNDA